MIHLVHDPKTSWRNHQRVRFIKGFYRTRRQLLDMIERFEKKGDISHETINKLLETNFRELKDLSHVLYRPQNKRQSDHNNQRLFDKILGTLWHELDKARDNIRLLEIYSNYVEPENGTPVKSLNRLDDQILKGAKKDLPRQLRRSKKLMGELLPLFEKIIPLYKGNEIILRTLYFSRHQLDSLCKPSTVEYFFPLLHGSVATGYFMLIRSLAGSGHFQEAEKALEAMRRWTASDPPSRMVLEEAEMLLRRAKI